MEVSKTGFVYRIAYGRKKEQPDTVSICQLSWAFLYGFLQLPVMLGVAVIGLLGMLSALLMLVDGILQVVVNPYLQYNILVAASVLLTIGLALYGIVRFCGSETYKLFKAYVQAKKQKVCPVVVCR